MKKILKYVILSLILVCLICGAVYKFVPFILQSVWECMIKKQRT